jgi:hypothetical protein
LHNIRLSVDNTDLITVPGQHWEVEFFEDGSIEIEVLESDGEIYDEKKLNELFDKFSD